jgi:hypothetical protein
MKTLFVFLLLSLTLQACTCAQFTPEEQEQMRERRAEMHAIGLRPGRD